MTFHSIEQEREEEAAEDVVPVDEASSGKLEEETEEESEEHESEEIEERESEDKKAKRRKHARESLGNEKRKVRPKRDEVARQVS